MHTIYSSFEIYFLCLFVSFPSFFLTILISSLFAYLDFVCFTRSSSVNAVPTTSVRAQKLAKFESNRYEIESESENEMKKINTDKVKNRNEDINNTDNKMNYFENENENEKENRITFKDGSRRIMDYDNYDVQNIPLGIESAGTNFASVGVNYTITFLIQKYGKEIVYYKMHLTVFYKFYYSILHYIVLYHIILYNFILYYIIFYYIISYYIIIYPIILYYILII